MRRVGLVLFLTVAWMAITGSMTVANVLLGLVVAVLSLWIARAHVSEAKLKVRPLAALLLAALFIKELAMSAYRVAVQVLTPRLVLKPGIFAFPLTVTRDFEITLLANLITLTPGTLSVDVSRDRRLLYVHALDCSDPVALKRDIAGGFERRIREAFPL
ncbi:multisubunit Na+/H+ antiporter MnhE subunit [Pararhizobium capsulatum DSM 1112]|uniref:Multisubunit Na+/H+ antiporter MnhE subunit n=1 Tax=Pararhizobium capsulatum DSM 1112 TaxID=1121113 RepID=A0ABU0BMU1_9HYPH|nr:Na+/H+ antiporter subunit E [Pararhizobium capsulatum]MDQ0319573.1 multisubunit Na+/H+ antiporter MnhE subunit [Pararhizobium capsulatum DSM 1112]